MSSVYQPKTKELAKVKVVSSINYSNNRRNLKLLGTIQRSYANFITTQRNKKTGKCSFVDDTTSLTKRSKNDLVKFFMNKENKGKSVAYLVVDRVPKKNKKAGK